MDAHTALSSASMDSSDEVNAAWTSASRARGRKTEGGALLDDDEEEEGALACAAVGCALSQIERTWSARSMRVAQRPNR